MKNWQTVLKIKKLNNSRAKTILQKRRLLPHIIAYRLQYKIMDSNNGPGD